MPRGGKRVGAGRKAISLEDRHLVGSFCQGKWARLARVNAEQQDARKPAYRRLANLQKESRDAFQSTGKTPQGDNLDDIESELHDLAGTPDGDARDKRPPRLFRLPLRSPQGARERIIESVTSDLIGQGWRISASTVAKCWTAYKKALAYE
jgi:hypothetical protein